MEHTERRVDERECQNAPRISSNKENYDKNNAVEVGNDDPASLLFDMSEEFEYMFRECDSSDVLQLLRENWHHYSQWIEGTHMTWQSGEFVTASAHLKNRISTSSVRTMRGLSPLNETVLANLDMQLDQDKLIPAVELNEPEHPEWTILSYFGVLMKSDVNYYLRCLIAISSYEKPDIDTVAYVYEQIQSKYTGNEELIRYIYLQYKTAPILTVVKGCVLQQGCRLRS